MKRLLILLSIASLALSQTTTQVDWNTQIKNRPNLVNPIFSTVTATAAAFNAFEDVAGGFHGLSSISDDYTYTGAYAGSPSAGPADPWARTGTVTTSGTAVHRLTGTIFTPDIPGPVFGGFITIAGTQYSVASVTDQDNLILTTSAGTQTGVPYLIHGWGTGAVSFSYTNNCETQYSGGTWACISTGVVGPVVDSSAFSGVDCGAKINTAYAALPSTGGQIIVPAACSFSTPIVFATANKPVLFTSFGNAAVMTYTGTTGVAITFNNGPGFDFVSAIQNLTLTGPGNASSTIGLLLGGSNGAVGFSMSRFLLQSFGTVVQTSSNTWITKFDHGMLRNGTTLLLEPSGQTNAGENVEFDHVTFADSPAPHTNAVWVQGGGQETVFNTCSFDQAQLRIGNGGTSAAQVVITNSHFENPNFATGGVDFTFLVVDHNNGNYVRFTDSFFEQDRTAGGAYASFMNLAGGVVHMSGVGLFTPAQLTAFAVLSNAVNVNLFGYNDLSGQTVALYSGSTTGYIQSYPGANTATSSGFNAIQGAGDILGPAASSIIQDLAVGTAGHNHNFTVNGNAQVNTGNFNISGGALQVGGTSVIDNARNGSFANGTFTGSGSTTAGEISIHDTGNAAGISLFSSLVTREATWLGTSAASLEIVNAAGTNDLVIFNGGTLRLPNITPSGSGGAAVCIDSGNNFYKGPC